MVLAFKVADCLGWLAYRIDRRHRQVAADNLRLAFPELAGSPQRIDRLVRATYRHMTTMAVEIALLPRKLHVAAWRRFVTLRSGTRIIAPFFSKRPNLFVTAHFGNWEMAGWVIGLFGVKSFAIARVLDNPYLERYLKRFRQATGQTIIAKKDDFKRLTAALQSGGTVGTLADQDAGPRGLFVDFFGRPASTHKAVALMAIEYDALISVITVPRVAEPMIYAVECEDVIDPRSYAGRPDAVQAITQRFTTALERMIRRHPEQYFWLHRRWKHQPARRQKKPAQAA
jgi:KDO2-lipid IV(A) lauroyltransferase